MFEDIIGEKEKPKKLILEHDGKINYVYYKFDGGQLEVKINFSHNEVEISGPKNHEKYCYDKLRDIDSILKDKSPFERIENDHAQLKKGWAFI